MATNLRIDPELLDQAHRVGGHRTKRATVTAALEEYIHRRRQQEILGLFGKIDYDESHDSKRERRKR